MATVTRKANLLPSALNDSRLAARVKNWASMMCMLQLNILLSYSTEEQKVPPAPYITALLTGIKVSYLKFHFSFNNAYDYLLNDLI
jgi:hypothetical protein